jgi:hypothetical protein
LRAANDAALIVQGNEKTRPVEACWINADLAYERFDVRFVARLRGTYGERFQLSILNALSG